MNNNLQEKTIEELRDQLHEAVWLGLSDASKFIPFDELKRRYKLLYSALTEIYELNPGSYGYDSAELASARWEIAAKALGKL